MVSDHPISLELFAMHLVYMCSARQIHSSVMDENPLAFATALQPYIKRHENTTSNAMQLQCCISVLDAVVKEVGCLSLASAIEMEKDLRFLLLRNTFHGVLYYAVRCICSIAETLNDSNIASGALQISRRFVKLLRALRKECSLLVTVLTYPAHFLSLVI